MNLNPLPRYRRYMPPIMAAVLAAAVAIPAALAGDAPDLVTALRAKGAQIVPLGARGGLTGYLVTPEGGDGYSLYVTGDGHGVAGLLYGPGGALLTGGQLAAVRGGNNPVGTAPRASIKPLLPPLHGVSPVTPVTPALPPRGVCGSPESGNPEETASGAGAMASATAAETATPDTGPETAPETVKGASRADLFGRALSAFGFTLGERGPRVVLFGDARCPWSRSAVARIGREAMAGKLRLHVVPVALLGAASARRAAAIAASPDPAQAWFSRTEGPAGPEALDRIARNNAVFDAWGERSVPLIAYRTRQGGIAHRVGDIADLGAWLRELGNE